MVLTSWPAAVSELMTVGKVKNSQLAREVGIDQALTHHYLRRVRKPSRARVEEVNAALARLLGLSQVADFLDGVWLLEHLEDEEDPDHFYDSVSFLVLGVERYSEPGVKQSLVDAILDLPTEAFRRLLRQLNVLYYKRVIRAITGDVPRTPAAIETIKVLEQHGVDLTGYLNPEGKHYQRAFDADYLAIIIARAIATTKAEIFIRNAAEKQIMAAVLSFQSRQVKRAGWEGFDLNRVLLWEHLLLSGRMAGREARARAVVSK